MSTIMSFHKVTSGAVSEEFGFTPQEKHFLEKAITARGFDSEQKITYAIKLMQKDDFTKMLPETMGRIFGAMHFTSGERDTLKDRIGHLDSLAPCLKVLLHPNQFSLGDFEFEIMSSPLTRQEEGFLVQANHASHFDSQQKITFAVTLMKKKGFATMLPQKMGRIFEAFRFTHQELVDLTHKMFTTDNALHPSCLNVLAQASLFNPNGSEQKDEDAEIEENSKFLKAFNTTASFLSEGIDTIFQAPFKLALRVLKSTN